MNDVIDAVIACALGFGMWCCTEAPEAPAPPAAVAGEHCALEECERGAPVDSNRLADSVTGEDDAP